MRVTAWDTPPTINRWSHQRRLPAVITGPAIASSSSSGPSSPNLFKCTSSPGTTSLFAVTFAKTLVHLEFQLWRDWFPFSFGSVPLSCHDYHFRHVRKCPARRRSGMAFHSTSRPQPVLSADSSHSRVNNNKTIIFFCYHFHSRTVSRSRVESSNFHSRSISSPVFIFVEKVERDCVDTVYTQKETVRKLVRHMFAIYAHWLRLSLFSKFPYGTLTWAAELVKMGFPSCKSRHYYWWLSSP
jgi:hypothetical protein